MVSDEESRTARLELELLPGGAQEPKSVPTYPQLEDIVLRGLTARTDGGVLDRACDVIVALEMAGVVEVSGRCHGPLSRTSVTGSPALQAHLGDEHPDRGVGRHW